MDDKLLRSYVRVMIQEYGGRDPGEHLYKSFIQPFVDVGETALYSLERLSSRGQQMAGVAISGLAGMIIPFAKGSYEKIDANHRERVSKIKGKYKDVLDRTDKAMKESDFRLAMFLHNPVEMMSSMAVYHSPENALGLLDMLSGQSEYILSLTDGVRDRLGFESKGGGGDAEDLFSGMFSKEDIYRPGKVLKEEPNQKAMAVIKKIFALPNVQKVLARSKVAKEMKEDSRKMVAAFGKSMVQGAEGVVNDITIERVLQSDKKAAQALEKIEEDEREEASGAIVAKAKELAKGFFQKQLQDRIGKYKGDAELQQILQHAIKSIETLK